MKRKNKTVCSPHARTHDATTTSSWIYIQSWGVNVALTTSPSPLCGRSLWVSVWVEPTGPSADFILVKDDF